MGHNLTCMGNITDMFASSRGFGVGLLKDVRQILPRLTPVAMATKFETKTAISRLMREISPRFLNAAEVFHGRAIE